MHILQDGVILEISAASCMTVTAVCDDLIGACSSKVVVTDVTLSSCSMDWPTSESISLSFSSCCSRPTGCRRLAVSDLLSTLYSSTAVCTEGGTPCRSLTHVSCNDWMKCRRASM